MNCLIKEQVLLLMFYRQLKQLLIFRFHFLLTYLLASGIDDNASYPAKAIIHKKQNELKTFIESKKKSNTEALYAGHLLLALTRMNEPEKAKPTVQKPIPPGAPIGCDWE